VNFHYLLQHLLFNNLTAGVPLRGTLLILHPPEPESLVISWDWRIEVILLLLLAGTVYTLGWSHLRRQKAKIAALSRLVAYLGGLVILGLALISPIDGLASQLFAMHMVQHLLLAMFAPPLLLIANPLPFILWGLPKKARLGVGRLLRPKSAFRQTLHLLTPPGVVWMVFIATFLGWHDPKAYNAALRHDLLHDVEHFSFFLTAMLFWWHVTSAAPHIHRPLSRTARIAFLLITAPINMLTGLTIAFASQPIYTYYTEVPRLWGFTVMEDQILGGVIMWIPGSMMFIIAALILIAQLIEIEENKPPLPISEWAQEEALLAPGWQSKSPRKLKSQRR
jgi:cytochrome c oxidase assembly factor CtaG